MKRHVLIIACLAAIAGALLLRPSGDLAPHQVAGPVTALSGSASAQDFRPLPFHAMAKRVGQRYRGRLIGADITHPTPRERELGAALIYEFRIITPQQNLLKIRMDARDGRFLEIAGRGQTKALRKGGAMKNTDKYRDAN